MQTEVQEQSSQSDAETRERIMTAIKLSSYTAVRSILFRIEQGVVDIQGRFPSFYVCQVAIESVKRIPGVVRVINHSDVVYDLPRRDSAMSDWEEKTRMQSIVVLPATEEATLFCCRTTALRSYDESTRYAGAAIHD